MCVCGWLTWKTRYYDLLFQALLDSNSKINTFLEYKLVAVIGLLRKREDNFVEGITILWYFFLYPRPILLSSFPLETRPGEPLERKKYTPRRDIMMNS